jgi:hypothetical protein
MMNSVLVWFRGVVVWVSLIWPVFPAWHEVLFSEMVARTGEQQAPNTGWVYTNTSDKFKGTVHKASIQSPTKLEFAYPYAGGSTATLTVREKENTTHVYVEVSKGQFNRSYQGGNASIAFDQAPAQNYPLLAAENGRANIIFLDADKKFIDKLKRSTRMLMTMEFQGQGKHRLEFKTAGFNWKY